MLYCFPQQVDSFSPHSTDLGLCWCPHVCVCIDSITNAFYASAYLPEKHTGTHAFPVFLPSQSSPLAPTSQLTHYSPSRQAPPSTLTVPPIWLQQQVQTGQPSRSLSKAAEYSSSLGVSPPPLHPGLGPFNKEQVIQMEEGWARLWEDGGRWRLVFFRSYSLSWGRM